MNIESSQDGETTVVALSGRFDYETRRDFAVAVDTALQSDVRNIRIDMADVSYIDSSALGMLLHLRERARQTGGKEVVLANCGKVRQILDIACFGKLFLIV